MPIVFYPHEEDMGSGGISEKLEILLEAAGRYKAAVLDSSAMAEAPADNEGKRRLTPKQIQVAFNWEEISKLLREIRELPESNPPNKAMKADALVRLAEVYEVLRGAKMPKLEAVRIALTNEANQLRAGGTTQVT